MASYLDGLAHQARISKVSAGTLSVRALRPRVEAWRNERPAMLADESDNEINTSWLIKKNTFWRNCTLYFLREKQQKDRKLSLDEFNQFRSLVCKISWVAKESRPEASGSASILAQHLKAPTVSDVLIANRVVKFLRSSTSQCLTIWRHDPRNLRVISVSDAGGIGGPPTENGEKRAECSSDHGHG